MSMDEAHSRLTEYAKEFGARESDMPFMKNLLQTAIAKQKEIDEVIVRAAPEWPIDKIAAIDRNVLRLGLTELLYADRAQVPAKVAINEAIELAKQFGGDNSGRFVNGVLGAVYKELGEPGKEESGKRKRRDVPYEEMPLERLAGAVVYAEDGGETYLALVHDIFGHWTLAKGRIEENENIEGGAVREIQEELGLDITIEAKLGENEYVASDPEIGKKRKHVTYFLARSPYVDITLEKKGGLDDGQWFKVSRILELNFYEDILPIVTKAITMLVGKGRAV